MSKSKLSSRLIVGRIALFTVIGSFLLIFMAAGTSAAGFSFMNSVKEFLGVGSVSTSDTHQKSVNRKTDEASSKKAAPVQNTIVKGQKQDIVVGHSYYNDTTPPLRDMLQLPIRTHEADDNEGREANKNPEIFNSHIDSPDPVIQSFMAPNAMPTPIQNFNGIGFPGVACNCAPPDTDGEVGATQYVHMVNEGYQVFNKNTGVSVLGPSSIDSLWAGFTAPCTAGSGDPIVLYDQIADRWLISQFAGSPPTDECIAISTTNDATGSYNRYGFHLGSNFFDYPHIGVWPDGYYMSDNVFNSGGTARLGTQAFAFDRVAMLAGLPATFVSPGLTPGGNAEPYALAADLDGSTVPPVGTACPFVAWPGVSGTYKTYLFHADFGTPANTTYTLRTSPAAAAFTSLCPATRACVPELAGSALLDEIGDRLMHRLAYRIIGGVERIVGNYTVSANSVAGIRWFELRNVTSGTESVFQESTYQPDTDWRWMGSAAQDTNGNMALGFSASSTTINPQIRYAGRLATDPVNTLAQGEAHLFDGTGSQTGTGNRWGDYSALSIDPIDDCTFWYTQEYYATNGTFNWRTRVGSFKFPSCSLAPSFSLNVTPSVRDICAPANAVYTVNTTSIQGFTDPVVLTATGNPAGTTVTFLPNPVIPGGSSTMTVGNTGAAVAGNYTINVKGTSGTIMLNQDVTFKLTTASPGNVTLTAPANGATNQALSPTFTWTASTQAATYTLEIATDAGFSNIIHTASGLTATTYSGAMLSSNTPYFWRVRGINTCGTGQNSPAFSFTTALICIVPFTNAAPITILDNLPANPYPSNINVSGLTGTITKVTVDLTGMTHTFPDDIDIMLVGPNGQNTLLMSDAGGSLDVTNVNLTFDDAAAAGLGDSTQIVSGTFKPTDFDTASDVFPAPAPAVGATVALSVFNGTTPNGTWSLYVRDDVGVDTGSISGGWTLRLTTSCSAVTPSPTATASPSATATATASPSGTPTNTATRTSTATATGTATATATPTATGTPGCGNAFSYTGPAVAIPDNAAAGVNFTIPVSGVGTISDLNFRFDGIQSADPLSTTPGINHSWVGDILVKITSPGGTTVSAFDRPGVPVTTVGCSNNNLAQIVLDDDGGFPTVESQCNVTGTTTNNAFPTGSFSPNNLLSAFDGQNANGNWVINISDNAGIDTGSARAFSLVFGGTCGTGTPTATNTATAIPTVSDTATPQGTPTATATSTPSGGTSIQFSSVAYTEDESQTAVITVTRTGNTTGTDTAIFSATNGTATGGVSCTSGVDYFLPPTPLVVFNPGVTTATAIVPICTDTIRDPNETVNLALTGQNVGTPATAVLTINDTASAYRATAAICTTFGQPASPYPSTIAVAGGPAAIGSMRVTLFDVAHTIPDSMDFLLVGPTGQKFVMMADAGGTLDLTTPVTLTFSDVAGQVLPNSAPLTTGVFEPTSWEPGQASFAAPAPPAPYNEAGSMVGGNSTQTLFGNFGLTNGNGTWSLYMRDDAGNFNSPSAITGCVNGGWGLELFASTAANASISGRILTANGAGIRNAKVTITGNSLVEPRVATTGSFGYFTFEGLAVGETYIVTVNSQRYTFSTPSRVISLVDNIADMDFIANPVE